MKNKLFLTIICLLFISTFFIVISNTVSAEWDSRGYFFTLRGDPVVATITGYNGSGGSISIPVTLGLAEYLTVAINDSAFSPNSIITSVSIPFSITTIGDNSFKQCSALTAMTIGNNVTTIGSSAFKLCNSLTSITFLGLAAPTVGANWIQNTPAEIRGHAYPSSNFPPPGSNFYGLTMGEYLFENTPPTFIDPAPMNQSIGVNRYHPTNVTVNDLDGNAMTVCFWYSTSNSPYVWVKVQQNDSVPADTTVRVLNSSYASGWNTQYWWRVTAYDGHVNSSVIYLFRTQVQTWSNRPPTFANPAPVNQSTEVNRFHMANVTVNDLDGNVTTVCFLYSTSNSPYVWVKVQQNDSVPADTTVRILNSSYASEWNTQYWWKVTAYDGHENASVIYTFTTKLSNAPPVLGAPTPANGSTGNLQGLSWRIPINDLEGNPFNWTIQCSNTQSANASGTSNGTKSLTLTGLAYLTTYKIWVNATDPTGSNLYTRKWFTFTTKSAGGTPPGGGTSENQKPIADLSAGDPYQGFLGLPLQFNGLQSHDPDGNITQWSWMFGDTTNGTGGTIWHTYAHAGTYTVTLTVTDDDGATDTDTTTCVIIQPNRPPTLPLITGPENGTQDTMYTFTAVAFDDDNDTIQYSIVWGDETAYADISVFLPNGTLFTGGHQWTTAGKYTITVTATDTHSSSTSTKIIWIDAVNLATIGYLIDRDGDGSYEIFRNESTSLTTNVGRIGTTYLIDNDGDGKWEYTYDAVAGLILYQEPKTSRFDLTQIVGIISIIVICTLLVIIIVLRRKGYI